MGTIKTTNIETITGSGTLTLGQSGETISVPSGATLTVPNGGLSGQNYPAFEAVRTSSQSLTTNTQIKLQFDTENFDTDSAYDNSTNYRFTPQVAGKYFVYSYARFLSISDQKQGIVYIYKNGSSTGFVNSMSSGGNGHVGTLITKTIDLNGSTDYVESFGYQDSGSSKDVQGSGSEDITVFGAYRIGS